MFKFVALLFVFGFLAFLTIGVFLGRIIRFFNPSSSKTKAKQNKTRTNNSQSYENPQKKFSKNEGEYVNFEEIKDDK